MILSGKPVVQELEKQIRSKVIPSGKFVVVQVGSDPVSNLYIDKKRQMAEVLGIDFEIRQLNQNITQPDLLSEIRKLNRDLTVRAILVQMPLPKHLDRLSVAAAIDVAKDVDGFHYILGDATKPIPPTVMAISDLLNYYNISLRGKDILIVGRGFLVGRPLLRFFQDNKLKVSVLLARDKNYYSRVKMADVVISATGGGGRFVPDNFKDGAVVIDASTVNENNIIKGDVRMTGSLDRIALAPVPGGIGPITVCELFLNFINL